MLQTTQTLFDFCTYICLCRKLFRDQEENVLFNDALNTFYLRLYGVTYMVNDNSVSEREETRCRHMGYSFRLAVRVLLYAPSQRQDSTYYGLCYTSRGALAGTRSSSMGPSHEGSIRWPIAPWANALTTELHLAPHFETYSILRYSDHKPTKYTNSVTVKRT